MATFQGTLLIDLDGVLHPFNACELIEEDQHGHYEVVGEKFTYAHDLEAILRDFQTVRVVVHSTWRKYFADADIKRMLPPLLQKRFRGCTPREFAKREAAIAAWHARCAPGDFVILDSHPDFFAWPGMVKRVVACDPVLGISDPATQLALRAALAKMEPTLTIDYGEIFDLAKGSK